MKTNNSPLYEPSNTVKHKIEANLPSFLAKNLKFPPRFYQKTAFWCWCEYLERHQTSAKPLQVLFNMATGSGKTYVMAMLILDLYRRGYRNFIFFVSSTNILAKTRDNFLHSGSPKYLFAPELIIQGRPVVLREVESFADSDRDAINIVFTTTQRLHYDLNHPHENRLTATELAEQNVVLIGDEAHHNNAKFSPVNKMRENYSWEETIEQIMTHNSQTALLEFTATLDFDDPKIQQKYAERLIYRYDLRRFREDGFSKDVLVYATDDEPRIRMLQAIIISQFRKCVAQSHRANIKPVVMFKSRTVYDNKLNLESFIDLIAVLTPEQVANLRPRAQGILQQAFDYFAVQGISDEVLCAELQRDFRPENLLAIDGSARVSTAKQRAVNTLELPENPYRAIFAVDMLKEGWDVLNLFDIVRLYETHGSKKQIQKTTISEAQLIGRGARYCPFPVSADLPTFQRKFDQDIENPLRVLEQLHYHTSHDVSYINQIQQTLDESGITNFVGKKLSPKKPVQADRPAEPQKITIPKVIKLQMPSGVATESRFFESAENRVSPVERSVHIGPDAEITPHIIYATLRRSRDFDFNNLQHLGLSSYEDLIEQLSHCEVIVSGNEADLFGLTQEYKLRIAIKLLEQLIA